ncbi:nitronate monooxygenase [Micromonospora echinofusca]|uniref:nitronate monooxygenase n=1 Tax=Micromonospora echinofusca TaxID=47858 RepID=UPI0033C296CD
MRTRRGRHPRHPLIGGPPQLTSQAVPPDEHSWIEQFGATASYRALRTGIHDYYRRHYPLTVRALRERTDALVLADVSTVEEGVAAVRAGADAVATTLAGYTPASPPTDGPDLTLLARLAGVLTVPVIAEGRYRSAEQIAAAFAAGAHAVVVGNAVTSPLWITRRLVPATPAGVRLT